MADWSRLKDQAFLENSRSMLLRYVKSTRTYLHKHSSHAVGKQWMEWKTDDEILDFLWNCQGFQSAVVMQRRFREGNHDYIDYSSLMTMDKLNPEVNWLGVYCNMAEWYDGMETNRMVSTGVGSGQFLDNGPEGGLRERLEANDKHARRPCHNDETPYYVKALHPSFFPPTRPENSGRYNVYILAAFTAEQYWEFLVKGREVDGRKVDWRKMQSYAQGCPGNTADTLSGMISHLFNGFQSILAHINVLALGILPSHSSGEESAKHLKNSALYHYEIGDENNLIAGNQCMPLDEDPRIKGPPWTLLPFLHIIKHFPFQFFLEDDLTQWTSIPKAPSVDLPFDTTHAEDYRRLADFWSLQSTRSNDGQPGLFSDRLSRHLIKVDSPEYDVSAGSLHVGGYVKLWKTGNVASELIAWVKKHQQMCRDALTGSPDALKLDLESDLLHEDSDFLLAVPSYSIRTMPDSLFANAEGAKKRKGAWIRTLVTETDSDGQPRTDCQGWEINLHDPVSYNVIKSYGLAHGTDPETLARLGGLLRASAIAAHHCIPHDLPLTMRYDPVMVDPGSTPETASRSSKSPEYVSEPAKRKQDQHRSDEHGEREVKRVRTAPLPTAMLVQRASGPPKIVALEDQCEQIKKLVKCGHRQHASYMGWKSALKKLEEYIVRAECFVEAASIYTLLAGERANNSPSSQHLHGNPACILMRHKILQFANHVDSEDIRVLIVDTHDHLVDAFAGPLFQRGRVIGYEEIVVITNIIWYGTTLEIGARWNELVFEFAIVCFRHNGGMMTQDYCGFFECIANMHSSFTYGRHTAPLAELRHSAEVARTNLLHTTMIEIAADCSLIALFDLLFVSWVAELSHPILMLDILEHVRAWNLNTFVRSFNEEFEVLYSYYYVEEEIRRTQAYYAEKDKAGENYCPREREEDEGYCAAVARDVYLDEWRNWDSDLTKYVASEAFIGKELSKRFRAEVAYQHDLDAQCFQTFTTSPPSHDPLYILRKILAAQTVDNPVTSRAFLTSSMSEGDEFCYLDNTAVIVSRYLYDFHIAYRGTPDLGLTDEIESMRVSAGFSATGTGIHIQMIPARSINALYARSSLAPDVAISMIRSLDLGLPVETR